LGNPEKLMERIKEEEQFKTYKTKII
jgi:hypothetical protein